MDNIRPIRSEADLAWGLAEVAPYFESEPDPGTPESDRFLVLVDLISAYENRYHPMPMPDPVDAIRHAMEASGRTQKDLAALLGSRSRASEILRRRRGLTVAQIDRLHREWHIPAEVLIRPFLAQTAA